MIGKGKTIEGEKPSLEELNESIGRFNEKINLVKRELVLREKILNIQKTGPTVLNPNFSFESKPEYEVLTVEQWELQHERAKMELEAQIEIIEGKITLLNRATELEKEKKETDEEKEGEKEDE